MRYQTIIGMIAAGSLLGFANAHAQEDIQQETFWQSLQIHGFASQGYVHSSANQFYGDSTDGSFEFTELGINASLSPRTDLLFSAQLLVRNAGSLYDLDEPVLDFALADVLLSETEDARAGIRLGRIKNSLGLYNETRDVAFTRSGIFLPQTVYFDKVRTFLLSMDGVQGYGSLYGDFGELSIVAGGGQTQVGDKVESAYLLKDFAGFMQSSGMTWVGQVLYTSPDTRLTLGLSGVTTRMKFTPGAGDPLLEGYTDVESWTASIQYEVEDWQLSAEYLYSPLAWHNYGPAVARPKATIESYYLQGSYRIRSDVELMLRYEEGYGDKDDKDGSKFETNTGGLIPARNQFSKIWAAGVRWDLNPSVMLRAEYQLHDGGFVLSNQENPHPADMVGNWDLFSFQASYRF